VSPVKYELGLYIPVDGILHSLRREYLQSHVVSSSSFIINTTFGDWIASGPDTEANPALGPNSVGSTRRLPYSPSSEMSSFKYNTRR
jgi:hypothetical protein